VIPLRAGDNQNANNRGRNPRNDSSSMDVSEKCDTIFEAFKNLA